MNTTPFIGTSARRTARRQCVRPRRTWPNIIVIPVLVFVAAATCARAADTWPSFLPSPDRFEPDVVQLVERIWAEPTLTRKVSGEPVRVPSQVYQVFVDAPDLTTAAARHLGLARYEVRRVGDDTYEANDRAGAVGKYHVLVHEPRRRILLSVGRHTSRWLGTVAGEALTVVNIEVRDDTAIPHLTAYVRIENTVAAALARTLIPLFGYIADRKLIEGFRVTAKVADWAWRNRDEFCGWLDTQDAFADATLHEVEAGLGPCETRTQPRAATSYRRPRHSTDPPAR